MTQNDLLEMQQPLQQFPVMETSLTKPCEERITPAAPSSSSRTPPGMFVNESVGFPHSILGAVNHLMPQPADNSCSRGVTSKQELTAPQHPHDVDSSCGCIDHPSIRSFRTLTCQLYWRKYHLVDNLAGLLLLY